MIDLNVVADTLGLHPRTVLRAIEKTDNPYWTKEYNPPVTLKNITDAFGCTNKEFKALLNGEDMLMTPKQASEFLNISLRTLRYRRAEGELTPIVARGSVVYYTRQHLLENELKKPVS